tara:strand:+ start:4980 stop:6080 length:1101 start_codon:yes stop_codon:yes gene_type:complete
MVRGIPYVTARQQVAYGVLIDDLDLAGDVTRQPKRHTIRFSGGYPCDERGYPIEGIRNNAENLKIDEDVVANYTFSAKPSSGKYTDYYQKITTYAEIISAPARCIDKNARANGYQFIPSDSSNDSVFCYLDTASSRAEISQISKKLEYRKIVIIGMGGTGGYVLDQIAKTPVEEIHIYDSDEFLQHNAFRAPGAASCDELESSPKKVDYFSKKYSLMHRGIIPHCKNIDESSISEILDADFVFICIDGGYRKRSIIANLAEKNINFIDVGLGLEIRNDCVAGILRVTASTQKMRDHIERNERISFSDADDDDEYDKNIQVADLNALNAILAVVKWKKISGFYADTEMEHHITYILDANELTNEDLP